MHEFEREGRGGADDDSMLGADLRTQAAQWSTEQGFADYVRGVLDDALEETPRRPGWVPCTTLWYIDGEQYLGRLAIRHRLTPQLSEVGGHVGYDVRPSARRRGHATAMLQAALPVASGLGIDRVLVTCDAGNTASRRVIEANGGVLEDQRGIRLRYWI
jgi:predicted acetyltransferase